MTEGSVEPVPFETFKDNIDTRGGYLQGLASSVDCFEQEKKRAGEEFDQRRRRLGSTSRSLAYETINQCNSWYSI